MSVAVASPVDLKVWGRCNNNNDRNKGNESNKSRLCVALSPAPAPVLAVTVAVIVAVAVSWTSLLPTLQKSKLSGWDRYRKGSPLSILEDNSCAHTHTMYGYAHNQLEKANFTCRSYKLTVGNIEYVCILCDFQSHTIALLASSKALGAQVECGSHLYIGLQIHSYIQWPSVI